MDKLPPFRCYEQNYSDAVSGHNSIATKPLILAVDDDEDNLVLLAYALEPLGCSLMTAQDGLNALSLSRTYQPDLILLDIRLPYMDGTEVLSQLKKESKLKAIPVIAVTALANAKDREQLLQAGCNDYISKPYMLDDIETKVQQYLRMPAAIF